jgi:RNA polymerase-binding transcription factor DksA
MALIDNIKATRLDLEERDHRLVQLIVAALDRMREGTYGRCIDCDEVIAPARLEAVPWASRCEDDQERYEQEHRLKSPSL